MSSQKKGACKTFENPEKTVTNTRRVLYKGLVSPVNKRETKIGFPIIVNALKQGKS